MNRGWMIPSLLLLGAIVLDGCSAKSYKDVPAERNEAAAAPSQSVSAGGLRGGTDYSYSKGLGEPPGAPVMRRAMMPAREGAVPADLQPHEELWVVARDASAALPETEEPPFTRLGARRPESTEEIPLPLKHTEAHAQVSGYIASVHLKQQYHNPFSEKIEAVYTFPLPHNAAVSEFVMVIGERHIRGIVREREEAEEIYEQARREGYVASLLTQERPNVFTQSVANIEPGKEIDIELTYFHTLRFVSGEYELVFPMVVGPRFNPQNTKDGVGAVARGDHGASGQPLEVHYLAPGERSGHDIGLSLDVDAGMTIESIYSPTHRIETTVKGPARRHVDLSRRDSIPNKDFVLRYKVAGDSIKSAFLSHRDERGGYFSLLLVPPASQADLPRSPMEMIFVIDCSGSMAGVPLTIAKDTVKRALGRMTGDDTFQIIQFSTTASQLGSEPLPATRANIERGLEYLAGLDSEGGTMMIEGIKAALDFPHDPQRLRIVSFLTDGFIGNDTEILAEVHDRLGAARIFSFGIGTSTNRYLLEQMAIAGKGAAAFVGIDESAARAVDGFYAAVEHAALTDVEIDWGNLAVSDVYPSDLPDLFVGRPIVVSGRFDGKERTTVRIAGRAGGRLQTISLTADPSDARSQHSALASIWARAKIADLSDRWARGDDTADDIRDVALEYGLASDYTAFVAVDATERTAGDHGTTVMQAVPVPQGVKYDTTVPENR